MILGGSKQGYRWLNLGIQVAQNRNIIHGQRDSGVRPNLLDSGVRPTPLQQVCGCFGCYANATDLGVRPTPLR